MYKITDEASLRSAIDRYMKFYAKERPQERFHCKTPLEIRSEALSAETPTQYPIAEINIRHTESNVADIYKLILDFLLVYLTRG